MNKPIVIYDLILEKDIWTTTSILHELVVLIKLNIEICWIYWTTSHSVSETRAKKR